MICFSVNGYKAKRRDSQENWDIGKKGFILSGLNHLL